MISLVLHGGAWDIPEAELEAHIKGCRAALLAGWEVLSSGGMAPDAVESVIRCMENDETFDAGYGAHLSRSGQVELDASIMNGKTLRCGAVANVHRVRNPISLARRVMDDSEHILLVGSGAERFALEHGIELCEPGDLVTQRERLRWESLRRRKDFRTKDAFHKLQRPSDTVGAVAMDERGDICAATSTGGTPHKYPGRVGDSPLIGCGTYADNETGGCSTTGWGEALIKVVMAKTVVDLLGDGRGARDAAEQGLDILKRKVQGLGGVIVLNTRGEIGIAYNTPRMARAYMTSEMKEPFVAV